MEGDFCVDEIVSRFFLDTCQPRFRVNEVEISALFDCARVTNPHLTDDVELCPIIITPLTTGSVAEFYIDPILSCIGDTDILFHRSDQLAIPLCRSPPTQLPVAEFSRIVVVYEIIDSEFPGYVYLRSSYLLDGKDGIYFARNCKHFYETYDPGDRRDDIHGPAYVLQFQLLPAMTNRYFAKRDSSLDRVFCVRCLLWPSQAADWPSRQRNSGWPDSATVRRVVSNGCDVVRVAHRLCRDDEWMAKYQWRLSFSRAEIVLLNNWMQVQQIMYHMLRVFLKSEPTVKTNDSGAKTLSNYHIKTLMLWACELKPRSWWNDDFNVVEICVKLLHILGVWLRDARCKHYFISKCNLLNHLDESGLHQLTAVELMSVTVQSLSKWFLDNYIRKCHKHYAEYCNFYDPRLFDDVSGNAKLRKAVTELVGWRHAIQSSLKLANFAIAQCEAVKFMMSSVFRSVRSCSYCVSELTKIDHSLLAYFIAVAFLYVAYKTTVGSLTDGLLNMLAEICRIARPTLLNDEVSKRFFESLKRFLRYEQRVGLGMHGHRTTPLPHQLNTSELIELLQQSAVDQLAVFRHLEAQDIRSVVTADFEALFAYKYGNYQRCLALSTHNVRTLMSDARLMPIVFMYPLFTQLMDDDIASLIALARFVCICYRKSDLHLIISQLNLSLYLMAQCQMKLRHSVTSLAQTLVRIIEVARYIKSNGNCQELTLEQLLLKLIERKILMYITS